MEEAGFVAIGILADEVSDDYANKWGYGLAIKDYIAKGTILATKPEA